MLLDDEWNNFIDGGELSVIDNSKLLNSETKIIPKCSELYISTKTKIIYLNESYDIYNMFWKIPLISYNSVEEGIIKKQIKISSVNKEEIEHIDKLLEKENYFVNKIINHIDNPDGRIKYKHVRKISIGISKKDLIFSKMKEKSAFYNCFVITYRVLYKDSFKEFHIKIFNTGKVEIPGLQNDDMLNILLSKILILLKTCSLKDVYVLTDKTENILINSNFNCGFYINREKLFNILRYKYLIKTTYDPCSYPGIQCAYYYDRVTNEEITDISVYSSVDVKNKLFKISYMIFRTGSILIVGKCSEYILSMVYEYIKNILCDEYDNIVINNIDVLNIKPKSSNLQRKFRKKIIYVNNLPT